MPANKKQHFVPKFLMRHFSVNEERTHIGLYNIHKKLYKPSVPLAHQAQEDYLYDNDSSVEDMLCQVEGRAAMIMAKILETSTVPRVKTTDYTWLLMFALDQGFRTPVQAEQLNQTLDETVKLLMKFEKKFDHMDTEGLTARFERPAANALGLTGEGLYMVADLSLKLLVNKTNRPFILSDNPLIKYNQFLEKLDHPGNHTGLLAKGLQMFLPISPTMMLVYYDKWTYDIKEEHPVVTINNLYDVDKLNCLQLINCQSAVYFSNNISEEYLELNNEKYKAIRDIPDSVNELKTLVHNNKLLAHFQPMGGNKGRNLNLSFIKPTKKALMYKHEGTLIPLRKEEWRGEIKKVDAPLDVVNRMFQMHPPAFID